MNASRTFILFFLFLICSNTAFSQYFNQGQERASIPWKHIQTENFEVIFPEGFDETGEQVARLLEKAYDYVSISLDHHPRKVSVILHAGTVKSNAFLGWSPSRIEMYTTPNQGIYSQDWLEQLSLHEYRHMVQVSKLDKEIPKILKYILGEHAAALFSGFYFPFWFIEGDAVATETGLSESGRGRNPDFHKDLHAQLVEKGKYSYDKAYLGSFRNQVPYYYRLGYIMVAGAREKYQKLVFDSVVHYIARHPFYYAAFEKGLQRSIGQTTCSLYNTIFDDLTTKWRNADSLLAYTDSRSIMCDNKYFTSYTNSIKMPNGSYFAFKSGLSDINRFVVLTESGKEKIIFTPGYPFDESVSARGNQIVWSERIPNVRWAHADKSLLRVYDVDRHKLSEYIYKSKVFAPALSPDGKKAVVVEADNHYRFFLSEIDLSGGKVINRYTPKEDDYFITPSYSLEGEEILTVSLRNDKKGIVRINMEDNTEEVVLPFRTQEIKRPVEHEGFIYFIGGYRGTDDLYALDKHSFSVYRVITSRFGIADYSFDSDSIIYSDYSADGYHLSKSKLNASSFQKVDTDTIKSWLPFADNLTRQEEGIVDFSVLDTTRLTSTKYSKPLHLFNFHSWAPISIDPYEYTAYPGVSFMSQNMLSTCETVLGYRYKWEEKRSELYLNYKYMGWFPVFNVEANYGKSQSYYYQVNKYVNSRNEVIRVDTLKNNYFWNSANVYAQVYLPLNFSKGKTYSYLYPMLNYRFSYYEKGEGAPVGFPQGSVNSLEMGLKYYRMLHQTNQEVYPRWGVLLNAGYLHSLGGSMDFGQYAYGTGIAYIPGFFHNHGVKLYGGYQLKQQKDFSLTDRVRFPRGYQQIVNNEMLSYGVDYKLPVAFPDWAIPRFFFLKKIDFGIFYDQAYVQYSYNDIDRTLNMKSAGCEVVFTSNFFRFFAPVEFGFRGSYLFDHKFDADFLFNINFTL